MSADDRITEAQVAVRHHLATAPGVVAAFLAGSLVEGYGNPTSDVDVLVLSDQPTPTTSSDGSSWSRAFRFDDCLIEVVYAGTERLDIETRRLSDLRATIQRLNQLPPDRTRAYEVSEYTFQFLHQLRVGLPVVGEEALAAVRSQMDWRHLATLLRLRNEDAYAGHAEDAAGAIQAGDAATAMLTSRSALGSAVDCLTAGLGHTNPKGKWRYQKLLQLGRDDIVRRCLAVEVDAGSSAEELLSGARRRLVAAQGLVAMAAKAAKAQDGAMEGARP